VLNRYLLIVRKFRNDSRGPRAKKANIFTWILAVRGSFFTRKQTLFWIPRNLCQKSANAKVFVKHAKVSALKAVELW